MKYEDTPEYKKGKPVPAKSYGDKNKCGYFNTVDGSDEIGPGSWVCWSPCNLKTGCPVCRNETICPICGKNTGYINDVGGITFTCKHC